MGGSVRDRNDEYSLLQKCRLV